QRWIGCQEGRSSTHWTHYAIEFTNMPTNPLSCELEKYSATKGSMMFLTSLDFLHSAIAGQPRLRVRHYRIGSIACDLGCYKGQLLHFQEDFGLIRPALTRECLPLHDHFFGYDSCTNIAMTMGY